MHDRTTNHLERLDAALSRPGRMDVWVEFKNASKWQAEALFRNFFPSMEEDEEILEGDLEGVDLPTTPASPPQSPVVSSGSSTLWSMTPLASSNSTLSSPSSVKSALSPPRALGPDDFGAKNRAYLPPPIEEHIAASQHSAKPLDSATLGMLAKKFADSIPEEEFSVAALQGCQYISHLLVYRIPLTHSLLSPQTY
jgi:chaperone BCS1